MYLIKNGTTSGVIDIDSTFISRQLYHHCFYQIICKILMNPIIFQKVLKFLATSSNEKET